MSQMSPASPLDVFMAGQLERASIRAVSPKLFVIAGVPASGKSYFAHALAEQTGALHISSDALRMALTDNHPVYSGDESMRTHASVRHVAGRLLEAGFNVIIDATSVVPSERRIALAVGRNRRCILVWCEADDATARARLARRTRERHVSDLSEADATVRERMKARAVRPTPNEASLVIYCTPEKFSSALEQAVREARS